MRRSRSHSQASTGSSRFQASKRGRFLSEMMPRPGLDAGNVAANLRSGSNSHFEFLGVPSCQPPALDATMSDFPPQEEEGR